MAIPQDFYTTATLSTLSGLASAVWIITSVIGYLLESKASRQFKKWFGLILSIALSLWGATLVKEQQPSWVVAVLNGFLIYATAVGANTFTEKAATAGGRRKPPVRETSADKAKRGNFTEAWW